MGEPARSASEIAVAKQGEEGGKSMEDILSSIRRIIAKENSRSGDEAGEKPDPVSHPAELSNSQPSGAAVSSNGDGQSSQGRTAQPTAPQPSAPRAETPSQTPGGLAALAEKMRASRVGRAEEVRAIPAGNSDTVEAAVSANVTDKPAGENEKPVGPAYSSLAERKPDPETARHEQQESAPAPTANTRPGTMSLRELAELAKSDIPAQQTQKTTAAQTLHSETASVAKAEPTAEPTIEIEAEKSSAAPRTTGLEEAVAPAIPAASQRAEDNGSSSDLRQPQSRSADTAQPPADSEAAFREALVAPATQAAVSDSMSRLKKRVQDIESAQVEAVLRPLLKEWLDNNLPSMVERMVSEEIRKISQRD